MGWYQGYLKGEHWADVKARFRASKLYTGTCFICGSKGRLDIHHKTYKNIGKERLTDLVALCRYCHIDCHKLIGKSKRYSLWKTASLMRKKQRRARCAA